MPRKKPRRSRATGRAQTPTDVLPVHHPILLALLLGIACFLLGLVKLLKWLALIVGPAIDR